MALVCATWSENRMRATEKEANLITLACATWSENRMRATEKEANLITLAFVLCPYYTYSTQTAFSFAFRLLQSFCMCILYVFLYNRCNGHNIIIGCNKYFII